MRWRWGAAVIGALLLSSCTGIGSAPVITTSVPPSTISPEPAPTPSKAPLTGADIAEWAADTEWSFAPAGLLEPFTVALVDGKASDDLMRTYELGDPVEGDANGDGVIDAAIPITEHDGNGVLELWYIWLGNPDAGEGEPIATQVEYPIARMTRCGDAVHEVTATEQGFAINETLRMPHTDDARDCASGGTGHQVREVAVLELDGGAYPVQATPVNAWGGICPRSQWLDGLNTSGATVRSAPTASAPEIIGANESFAAYELPEAPLMTRSGVAFFGFQDEHLLKMLQDAPETPIRMHCGFADPPG